MEIYEQMYYLTETKRIIDNAKTDDSGESAIGGLCLVILLAGVLVTLFWIA